MSFKYFEIVILGIFDIYLLSDPCRGAVRREERKAPWFQTLESFSVIDLDQTRRIPIPDT
jgi:hypothetical protein